jgi:magnesium transporter
MLALKQGDRRYWIRAAAPRRRRGLGSGRSPEERDGLLGLLDERTRHEVNALMAYAEDEAAVS